MNPEKIARQGVEPVIATGWGARTPIDWPNFHYKEVEGTRFLRVRFGGGIDSALGIGKTQVMKTEGWVSGWSVIPEGTGTRTALEDCDLFASLLRFKRINVTDGILHEIQLMEARMETPIATPVWFALGCSVRYRINWKKTLS